MKTYELSGTALDYAVALCEKGKLTVVVQNGSIRLFRGNDKPYKCTWSEPLRYSSNWLQGGLNIEREQIGISPVYNTGWAAGSNIDEHENEYFEGNTALEAAMRCYVFFKFGENVEIPNEIA